MKKFIVTLVALCFVACSPAEEETDSGACAEVCGLVEPCGIELWTCDSSCDDAALEDDAATVVCASTYAGEPLPGRCSYLTGCIRDLREVSPN